jgi:murein DD-endopeptidase MepM/ murein hydrolase activator NlpD
MIRSGLSRSHLHYEARVDGEVVDPQKFLKAGAALFGI